jgi:hypothetical protein
MPVSTDEGCGDRVLEDELFEAIGLKDYGVPVEGTHRAGNLYAIEQMHSDVFLAQKSSVKKRLLNVAREHDACPIEVPTRLGGARDSTST